MAELTPPMIAAEPTKLLPMAVDGHLKLHPDFHHLDGRDLMSWKLRDRSPDSLNTKIAVRSQPILALRALQ